MLCPYHEDAGHRAGESGQKPKLGVRRPTSHSPAAGWVTSGRAAPAGSRNPPGVQWGWDGRCLRSSQPRAGPGPPSHWAGAARRSERCPGLSRPGGLKGLEVGGGAWTQCMSLAPRGCCVQPGAVAGSRARSPGVVSPSLKRAYWSSQSNSSTVLRIYSLRL